MFGRKAKYGQAVTHSATGRQGTIASIVGHTIRVVFKDGSEAIGPASTFHRTHGGCLPVILAFPFTCLYAATIIIWLVRT